MADKTLLVKIKSYFTAASSRANLVSGEELPTSLGKIAKYLGDLKTVAFSGSYNDLSNKPTIPDISTKVSKSGDTMDGSLTFKDPNSNDGGVIDASYDDYFAIEAGTDKIILLEGATEVDGYLQLDTVNRPSTSDNDNCQILGFVVNSDDFDRIGRVVKLYKSDIVTLASVTSALGYTPVPLSGGNVTGDIDFYDSGVGFYPDSGHMNGIHGSGGTMWVAFNDAGDTMYVGNLGSNAKLITIDSTGIYINGYKIATLNDIPSAAVSGVKGNTETDYRTGNVNITAANIGAVRYDTSSQGLTSTQKSNARTNLGLGSAATSPSSSFATATQGGYADDYHTLSTTAAAFHASVFRGKYLGSSFTSAQKSAISNGTFDDLYVGDYWTINGVNWRIADIDYFYGVGSSSRLTTHHLVIVPDTGLTTAYMYASGTSNTGYYNSYICQTVCGASGTATTAINNAFGSSYIMEHLTLLSNAMSSGTLSGYGEYSRKVDIMSQTMVFGSAVVDTATTTENYKNVGVEKAQFALFAHDKKYIHLFSSTFNDANSSYWLRDVRNADNYMALYYKGYAAPIPRTGTRQVRPYFCLKGA